jgi:PKD repeat protein
MFFSQIQKSSNLCPSQKVYRIINKNNMKNLKLLLIAIMVLLYAKSAQSACNAFFTKAISGLTVTFTNTSTTTSGFPNMMTYSWSFGDGTFSTLKNPVKTYATGGVKGVQLFINDSMGCTHVAIDTFILVAPTSCNASFTKTISGLSVAFTNTSTSSSGSNAIRYTWNFSDGTSSTLKNPTKVFTTIGNKIAQLSMFDSITSCTATFTDTFLLTSPILCLPRFTSSTNGLSVTLTNNTLNSLGTTSGLIYLWQFSDGTSATTRNVYKTFATIGVKTVRLTISDSLNICSGTRMDSIVIVAGLPPCGANFTKSISGLSVTLNNLSLNSSGTSLGLTYNWTFSDGTGSTQKNLTKTFATGGYKTIQLNIIDSANTCFASKRDSFNLTSTSCQANFTKTVSGLTATMNNTSLNGNGNTIGLAYTWVGSFVSSFPNVNQKNPILTFSNPGPQVIGLFIYDSVTNCTSSKSDSFNLVSPTLCNANFSKTISGLTVSLNNTSLNSMGLPNGLLFNWNFGDGTTSTARNPVKTFASAGLKTIQLTISDTASSCTATKYDTVLLVAPTPLCSARFALAIDTTTPFSFFLLNTSLIRPGCSFYWTFGDGGSSTSMTPTHSYATFGKYNVCLTISDTVCNSTYCDSIGMDSTGRLLKKVAFSFRTLDYTKLAGSTGLVKMAEPMQYHIYPNPSVGELNVEVSLKETTTLSFELTDISGKLLITKSIQHASGNYKESLDLSELKPSFYFLSIRSNQGVSTYKVIKN